MKKIRIFLNYWRILPIYIILILNKNDYIKEDILAWYKFTKKININDYKTFYKQLSYYLIYESQCRAIIDYRLCGISRMIFRILFPIGDNVKICMNKNLIGGGLYIYHGVAIVISAKKIGKNCTIYQQTTIGYNHEDNPIIGNNVTIFPGAKIFGGIIIEDNSIIGANCVINKNVKQNSIMVGVPGHNINNNNSLKD